MSKRITFISLILFSLILLTGCVPGDGTNTATHQAGFFWGIWHGWLAPISLVISLFNHHIRIYEIHNTGWWYDFGFYIAIISGLGGISIVRRGRNNKR